MVKCDTDLDRRTANHVPLSPASFMRRTARAFPDAPAIEFDEKVQTWRETYQRCLKLAAALRGAGIGLDSTIAVLARNIPAAVELSYAAPMSRGVLNMINTRLDSKGVGFILEHGEAELFFVDAALVPLAKAALETAQVRPEVIVINDPLIKEGPGMAGVAYEDFLGGADPVDEEDCLPHDEWAAIALNYTSGTTGNPKGVVYHHRGAYLNAIGNALEWSLPSHPRYLWTLPMFHCNGWCFPWTIAAKAGVNICLRAPIAAHMIDAVLKHDVTHMCGAPIILNMATTELERRQEKLPQEVRFMTAGAAPSTAVLARAEAVGFDIIHVYGLTEVYGPTVVCAWRGEWNGLPAGERAAKKSRQGVNYAVLEELSVRDPDTLAPVAADGETLGEVMFRGNVVMKGYLKDSQATQVAFADGRFRSGDLAVLHPDGHIQLKDRSKDIIISGGENISSIEVEGVLYQHSAISEAAVVAGPHDKWDETPVAFVELKQDCQADPAELLAFCRARLPHFKCPTRVIFGALPKTATGKVQKFELRRRAALGV